MIEKGGFLKAQILILSPHLDDAVFSCGDHIRVWRRQGHTITILTVFTRFFTRHIPGYSKEYIRASGCPTVKMFEKIRHQEDGRAASLLGVSELYFTHIDAGFRGGITPTYPQQTDLFSGVPSSKDDQLLLKLTRDFSLIPKADRVIVPFGVGRHTDHTLVRRAAELSWPRETLSYYVDFPYALHIHNWTGELLRKIVSMHVSVRWTTPAKRRILDCYASQTPLLFPKNPMYPEVVLSPNEKHELT